MWDTKCWLFTLPCGFSVASDTVTSRTVAHQAPQSMGFSQQEYWSGLPFPPPGDLSDRGVELASPSLQADSLPSEVGVREGINWEFRTNRYTLLCR